MKAAFKTFRNRVNPTTFHLWFVVILGIGVFARVWEFGALPAGLNPDEASIGVETYYLYKFGVDRYGLSYPVHLISWGSGQNAFYAYLLMPFVALKGVNAFSVRLPMMLAGILSLFLIYIAGERLLGKRFGLLAMFLMAVSPWHVVNSRWAVESNIMPFVFLAAFTALTLSSRKNWWFVVSASLFALCLYAYGTAYVGVPVFLFLTLPVLIKTKRISFKQMWIGLVAFVLIAIPIGLFLAVNTFRWETLHLGSISIPRLPVEARYETMAAVFGESPFAAIAENTKTMFTVLWKQEDAFPWNFVEPFGYFYKYTLPLIVIGFLLTLPFKFIDKNKTERWLIFSWMAASIAIGVLHPVNLTRINLIFTPILLCLALLISELDKRLPQILPASVILLLFGFVLFNRAYHGEEYEKRASGIFNEGIIPAIEYAAENGGSLICFTEQRYSLYIYVLLTQKYHPSDYVNELEWIAPEDPADPARTPRSLKQYRFRLDDCLSDPTAAYILTLKETPPISGIEFKEKKFSKFQVHLPK